MRYRLLLTAYRLPLTTKERIVGAATVAARWKSCLGKEDGPGRALPLQFFRQTNVAENRMLILDISLDRFYTEALVEIVIEIVEVEHCTIEYQGKLRNVRRVYYQVEIS